MRILLLGEYSGFYKNLKEGLIDLGHYVDILTTGDGYKKIVNSDLYIPSSNNGFVRKIRKILYPFLKIKSLYDYDVVQLIDHNIFGGLKYNYNYKLLKRIRKQSKKMFLSSCGTNYFVYNIREKLEYNYIDATIKYDRKNINPFVKYNYIKNNIQVANLVDGVIPISYTYKLAYKDNSNLLETIPLPININKIKYVPQNFHNNKIFIFHGISREGFKGTKFIKLALEKLKSNYPNDVEIVIDGKMPLDKYLDILSKTNIVVDQALSYEYGMNAMYSMAMGKVVLSGNEPECQEEFNRSDIPVINIKPDVDDIYHKLEKLVLNKDEIIKIGKKSREFVEDFHSHTKVAKQYIDVWNSVGGNVNEK